MIMISATDDTQAMQMLLKLLNLYGYAVPTSVVTRLLRLLHISIYESGMQGWVLGPSELSLVFDGRGAPRVRLLAEVLTRSSIAQADVVLSQIGERLLLELERQSGVYYDRALFRDLVGIAYGNQGGQALSKSLRFGIAVEWSSVRPVSVKCYFDLFNGGKLTSWHRLQQVFYRLGLASHWRELERMGADSGDAGFSCRIAGVDFPPGGAQNVKIYMPGTRCPVRHIKQLIQTCGYGDLLWQFDLFNTRLLNNLPDQGISRSLLIGLVFAGRLAPQQPIIKLDAFLPDYYPDDQAVSHAVLSLSRALDVTLPNYAEVLKIVSSGTASSAVQRIQQYCSLDILPSPKLNLYFRTLHCRSEHMSTVQRPRKKPQLLNELDSVCRAIIAFLERERTSGYATATHRMRIPSLSEYDGTEIQNGRIFQTALINCSLSMASLCGYEVDRAGIDNDIDDLARMRCHDVCGGWRYFPGLSEMPPDADDLAQVIQLLMQLRSPRFEELCGNALSLLFEHINPDGTFDTWIIDPGDKRVVACKILQAIAMLWGNGTDHEVMANMAYALSLCENDYFIAHAKHIALYLSGQQLPDGSWPSKRFGSPFYGTFVTARALFSLLPQNHSLGSAARYIWSSQRLDGGWGDGSSDPTSTALALSTAALLFNLGGNETSAIRRAVEYLLAEQKDAGIWSCNTEDKVDLLLIKQGFPGLMRTFNNPVMVSALCLQALCQSRPVLG